MEQYGHFCNNGYKITERNIPRHWYNYLFNDEYITYVSQVGFGKGFAQDDKGCRLPIVEDRAVYISDGERVWQATGLPVQRNLQHYHCFHGIGYTDIAVNHRAVRTECRFFVPTQGRREFLRVTLKNESKQTKTLKVIPYYATAIDGKYEPQGDETDWAKYVEEKNCVVGTGYAAYEDKSSALHYAYLVSGDTVTGYDTRHNAFIGPYGNKLQPRAIAEHMGCTNSECIAEKICFALENTVTLAPGESKVFYYTMGVEESIEHIPQYAPAEIEQLFSQAIEQHKEICNGVRIHTPWADLDDLCNDWLKYQTNMGSRWARVRHNGFRDLTSDTECLSCFNAELAAERLCRILSYQYDTGYAPRTFIDGKIQDKNFSDNAVWTVFTAYAITKELGDVDFLMRKVPFNNGETASIYEHVKRAVTYLWKFTGHMGLIKIWGGDWNDCMNKAGIDGKGVSVWLSIAFVRAAKMLSQMANWIGSAADSKAAAYYAQEMEKRVNQYAWDEDRYLYAISDDKHPIGAKDCTEGSIFALPQLWSILAEFADKERTEIAMNTLETELNTDLGLLISKPPYTEQLPYIGSMTRKYPGLHENGGVYLHAAMWKLAVDSMLGRNDKIEEGLRKILPGHHEFYETCGEPYAMFNSYLGEQTGYRAGKPGQSWRTASGQWLLYALVRFIYGLQPEFGGMLIRPCLPTSWKDCSISKVFRDCRYNIHYVQKDKEACNTIEGIYVNGSEVNANLPIRPQPGKTLNIEVILRA